MDDAMNVTLSCFLSDCLFESNENERMGRNEMLSRR